jgi:putative endonuclease
VAADMAYFVYVLRSKKDRSHYIGISQSPEDRLKEHNFGDSKYTKGHRPYELIYREEYASRLLARSREKYLKSGTGRRFLNKIIPL